MVTVTVSIVVSSLLYFLTKASKREVSELANGGYELRMNMVYQLIGIAGLLMSLVFLSMPILAGEYGAGIFMASGLMFLIFAGLSISILLWYKNHWVRFDDIGIVSHNLSGREQRMNWVDITSTNFRPFAGVMALSDGSGNVVKVHSHLVGFSTFIKTMLVQKDKYGFNCEKLPPTA